MNLTSTRRQTQRQRTRVRIDFEDVARFAREQWPKGLPTAGPAFMTRWRTLASDARAAEMFWSDEGTAWCSKIRPAYEEAIREGRVA